jgi:hypothetical protein
MVFFILYRNRFATGPLDNCWSLFDFGFEFANILVFEIDSPLSTGELLTPRSVDMGCRRHHVLLMRVAGAYPYCGYGKFKNCHQNFFLEKSRHPWNRESPTLRIIDTESRWLMTSMPRGVTVGELKTIHWAFKELPTPLKRQFGKKETCDVFWGSEGFI